MDALTISDNITTLYVYKIKNFIEKQKLETNSKNFIRLEFVGEFDATITARAKQTNLNLDNKILKLGLNDSLTVAIDDNFIFDENEFYFILGSKYQAHTGLYDAYYFETKIDELIFNDLGDDKIQEFTITKLKSFKELNDIEFIVVNDEDDVNNELEVVNADDKIDITSYQLEFYSSALINQIMHFKNDFFEVPNFEIKDNKKPILIFANPTAVYDNTYSLFLWNISKFYVDNWSVISFFLRRLTLEYHKNYEHYLKQIVNNGSHREILKECAYNTYVEFQGTETQRKEWADKNGNAKSSDINDYLIRNFLAIRPEAEKIKFLSLLLMFSEQIASSYCWKGGLNDEHKAALPMTAHFKDIANEYYVDNPRIVLESLLYSTNEQDNNDIKFGVYNQFLNKNIFFLNGKTVQFALTPDQFEEPELSQRPIDFNNKTLNLNYPFYLFLTEQDTSSILGLSSTIKGHSKEVIKDDVLVWSGIKDDNKAQTINWEQEVQKYLASEYPHSEFEFSILGRQDIYTRIVQVPIIIDNNNYYDIHFQKQKLHFNKGKFYLQEVDASQGLGYPPARHEYLKIRVVKKDYDNLFTFENQNLFMINNPNDLNKKINNHITKIEFFTNPDKVIIKGAFLQDYKIILKGGAFENGKEFNIKSDNKLTNKLIFWK
ncbi:hypothetical protein [Mycoplasmopsis cynos]|uniref:hypothetical protein n=1 Tax=Mycoplasmopsis cynos TaxID=171284 RepID=UPI0030D5EC6E